LEVSGSVSAPFTGIVPDKKSPLWLPPLPIPAPAPSHPSVGPPCTFSAASPEIEIFSPLPDMPPPPPMPAPLVPPAAVTSPPVMVMLLPSPS